MDRPAQCLSLKTLDLFIGKHVEGNTALVDGGTYHIRSYCSISHLRRCSYHQAKATWQIKNHMERIHSRTALHKAQWTTAPISSYQWRTMPRLSFCIIWPWSGCQLSDCVLHYIFSPGLRSRLWNESKDKVVTEPIG